MINPTILKAEIKDLNKLQDIARRTFFEAFSDQNTEEDMQVYLKNNLSQETLLGEMNNSKSEFYLAIHFNEAIGYLKVNISKGPTNHTIEKALEIERIYVLKEYYGLQVGQALLNKALDIATKTNAQYIWLGVWEKNPRAIQFYLKNGFIEFGKQIFKLGKDEQTDLLMRQEINYLS